MKKEDLRIGDWVHWQNRAVDPEISVDSQVRELLLDECHLECGGGDPFYYDELEPVRLTTHILDKNFKGYKSQYTSQTVFYYDVNGKDGLYTIMAGGWGIDFCMRYDDSEHDSRGEICLVELEDVHTLQHTLKLFGIEKEIVIR